MTREHAPVEQVAAAPPVAQPAPAIALPHSPATILALQRTAGNAAVSRMLARNEWFEDWGGGTATQSDLGPKILEGAYDGATYKPDGTGFEDPALDGELRKHGQRIGVDTALPPGTPSQASGGAKGGDSGGKPVDAHPPWVEVFQDHLSSPAAQQPIQGKPKTTQWSDEDKVAQRLLRIFLTRWTENAQGFVPPAVAELYENAGAYESNEATNEYGVGVSGAKDWCAQASSSALAEAMLKSGLRFAKPPPGRMKAPRYGVNRQTEINLQAQAYNEWVNTVGKKLGGVMGAEGARGAWLMPGDILSFYSAKHGPQSTGHVVTVVRSLEQPKVQVASGNAAGEAVRMEELLIAEPPPGFSSQSKQRPPGDKDAWIFSLVRASWLNAFVMWVNGGTPLPPDMYATFGVERCTPLDELYGSDGLPAAPKSGGDIYEDI